jgi:hypothetical protein
MLTADGRKRLATGHTGASGAGCTTGRMHRERNGTWEEGCAGDCIRTWGGKLRRAAGRAQGRWQSVGEISR